VEIRGVVIKIIRNMEFPITNVHEWKTLDLFAGIGGIRLGFEKAGFKTVFANDFDTQCKATYDLNFKRTKLVVEDIKKSVLMTCLTLIFTSWISLPSFFNSRIQRRF